MTAGRGILHREMAHNKQQVHTLQLWLNLPAESKMVEPTYHDLQGDKAPVRREPGVEARVFSGRSGNVKAIPRVYNYVPVAMLDVRLDGDEGTSFTQEIPPGDEGFVYVVPGQGYFSTNGTLVSAGQVGHLAHTSTTHGATMLTMSAKEPTRFLLWTGKPLR
jgi:redox-sensitive bicupin YhaK (pirin superfamily)